MIETAIKIILVFALTYCLIKLSDRIGVIIGEQVSKRTKNKQ